MKFSEFFAGILKRNHWKLENVVQCKVSALQALAQQAYEKGFDAHKEVVEELKKKVKTSLPKSDFDGIFDDLTDRMSRRTKR